MAEAAAPAQAPAADAKGARPTLPDEGAYQEALAKLEKDHQVSKDRLNAIRAKLDIALPNKNKDQLSPSQKRRQELIAQANEIRQKQASGKSARAGKTDQVKRLDEQLRSRITEQKNAKAKIPFKSAEDVDRQIASLEKQINSGTMKLVDEKKALNDVSNLKKIRKNFGQFDESQKQIDDLRAKIKDIKDSMEDPEQKAMSEQYNKIQAELDAMKAEQDEAYKGVSTLRDERHKLQAEQQEKFAAIRKLKDDYWGQRKAFQNFEREAREKARARREAEKKQYLQDKKKAVAEKKLAEASEPAYAEEIYRANSLLRFLDPTQKVEKEPLLADTGLGAQASRTVDDAGLKGTKLVRKEEREEEYAPAVKKGKKGKKGGASAAGATAATPKYFNCPPSVVQDCALIGVDPPMSSADVPSVIENVKAKLEKWRSDQAAQTKRNIEKAKQEIERLEKEDAVSEPNGEKTVATLENCVVDMSLEENAKYAES